MDEDGDTLFFPVSNVKFEDLHDWSIPGEVCQVSIGSVTKPRYNRQRSKTGSLTNVNETKVALFRYDSEVYAINEKCPHAGGPLHIGDIENTPDSTLCVRCPWHSWRFSLHTGDVVHPKGQNRRAKVYPVRVRLDGTILVGFKEFSPSYFTSLEDLH